MSSINSFLFNLTLEHDSKGQASIREGRGCEMLQYPSIETLARAKFLEMERLRSSYQTISKAELSVARAPKHRFDIWVRVALQPKFSIAITLDRGLS